MSLHTQKLRQAIRIAVLLGTACSAALANQSPLLVTGTQSPMCYCKCEQMAGGKKCTKMCELPQYENRWWATSCHKKDMAVKQTPSPAQNSHSSKRNRAEEAKL
jgi:hypothetical protein